MVIPTLGTVRYCLRNFDKTGHKDYLKNIYDLSVWTCKKDDITKEHIVKLAERVEKTPPEILAILCHGEADEVDPFASRLKLGSGGISLLELMWRIPSLLGSTAMPAACETEMTPNRPNAIDEHISIAGTFLTKGCSQVLGTLWEAKEPLMKELIECAVSCRLSLWRVFQCLQIKWLHHKPKYEIDYTDEAWSLFKDYDPGILLHDIAPFRVVGYPVDSPLPNRQKISKAIE